MSLRRRITAATALAVAGVAVMLAVVGYVSTRSELSSQIRQQLWQRSRSFVSGSGTRQQSQGTGAPSGESPGGGPGACDAPALAGQRSSMSAAEARALLAANPYFESVCPDGRVVAARGATPTLPVPPAAREIARTGSGHLYFTATVHGVPVQALAFSDPSDHKANEFALSEAPMNSALHGLLVTYLWLIGVGVVVAGIAGMLISRSALAPIRRFSADTEQVTRSPDRRRRLEESGAAELRGLASSFNHTLDALERSLESQRHLIADASHELRTPMAALRSNIQIFLDADRLPEPERRDLQQAIVAELDELAKLVSDVLALARGSMPSERLEPVELHEIVHEAADRLRRRAAAMTLELDVEPAVILHSPELVSRAVTNILDNARTWSPPHGSIEIALRDGVLSVRDHGPGFADEDLDRVFDRFYRSDNARRLPGSGLGLAIVKQAAEAHGGFASAANAPGGGAIVRISFGPYSGASASATKVASAALNPRRLSSQA